MTEKTCCVTGHRDIPAEQIDAVKYALWREIIKAVSDGYTGFMTGFADGADQYFAEMVVKLQEDFPNLRLIAVIPYRKRVDSLESESRQRRCFMPARMSLSFRRNINQMSTPSATGTWWNTLTG